jgi:hypothetical protein
MLANWAFFLLLLLTILSLLLFAFRQRRFHRRQALLQKLSEDHGLQLAFMNHRSFQIFGQTRNYPVQIEAILLSSPGVKRPSYGLQLTLPMTNPNRKAFRVGKGEASAPALQTTAVIDRPIQLDHGIAEWLSIQTNDAMFSGLILSDDVKISLFELFQPMEAGLLYVYDETLRFVVPRLLETEDQLTSLSKGLHLLCDIKDELNFA